MRSIYKYVHVMANVCGIQCLSKRLQQTEDLTETGRLFYSLKGKVGLVEVFHLWLIGGVLLRVYFKYVSNKH